METVVHGETGYLEEPTGPAFGEAILSLLRDPDKAARMGHAGRQHAQTNFGPDRLRQEWSQLVRMTVERRDARTADDTKYVLWKNTILYLSEAVLALLLCAIITWLLRQTGAIQPNQSIFGAVRSSIIGDEL